MKKYIAIFLTALIFCVDHACAVWNTPTTFPGLSDRLEFSDAYTDQTTKTVHVLTFIYGDTVYYLRFKNDVLDHIKEFPYKIYSGIEMRIVGEGDGKHLYIAMQDGNTNIIFMESDTDGETWTSPIKVNQASTCYMGSINYIYQTGRLYLVYNCYNRPTGVMFVSRPANSSVFSPERNLWDNTLSRGCSSTYTIRRNKPLIHVFFEKDDNLMYTQSSDNGVTWIPVEDVGISKVRYIRAISNTRATNTLFLFYSDTRTEIRMTYTTDNAETFEPEINFEGSVDSLHARICGTREAKLLATISFNSEYTHWKGWEYGKFTNETFSTPFYSSFRGMACDNSLPLRITMLGEIRSRANAIAEDTVEIS